MKLKTWQIILIVAVVVILTVMAKPIKKALTRGYQNKNPGNIRHDGVAWQGEVKGSDQSFKTFSSMAYGYRALMINLRSYIRAGYNTVEKIISRWAPSSENDTMAYIFSVSSRTGFEPEQILSADEQTLKALADAISYQENGITPDQQDIEQGYNLMA